MKDAVGDKPYSQFEITMAIALLWFEREKCDVGVVETGIGGLLDSTNIIPPPLLSVITSISLDHTAILGKTVEEIAEQKAGIIKGGSAVVLAEDNPDSVKELVRKKPKKVGAEFVQLEPCKTLRRRRTVLALLLPGDKAHTCYARSSPDIQRPDRHNCLPLPEGARASRSATAV